MTSTPERTPAEELRAAASELRAVAGAVTADRPTWFADGQLHDAEVFTDLSWTTLTGADAAWISAMTPALAEPLAEWLEDASGDFEAEHRTEPEMSNEFHALAVARVINGGAS